MSLNSILFRAEYTAEETYRSYNEATLRKQKIFLNERKLIKITLK